MNQNSTQYKNMKVKKQTVCFTVFGIVLYFADIISDISLAVNYYYDGHIKFFGLTLFLVILSGIVSSIFSSYMYWDDSKDKELKVSKGEWVYRLIFLTLCIAPVLRNIDSLRFAWKSYQSEKESEKQHYARRMNFEVNDSSFLRLFEAFIESGPQLVLQIYILLEMQADSPNVFTKTEIWQCCTMLISVTSISASIVSYVNSLRNSLDHKNELKIGMLLLLFIWRFFEVISRVIAMGFGIYATQYLHVVFAVHFIIVAVWIYFLKTDFCDNRYAEKFYNALLSVILTFVFLNPKDNPTKRRCVYFYLAMFAENSFLIAFWFYKYSSPDLSFKVSAMIVQLSSFCFSIILMVIYYKFFHPTVGKICKKRSQDTNTLNNDVPEPVVQNGEANAMLEMVQNTDI